MFYSYRHPRDLLSFPTRRLFRSEIWVNRDHAADLRDAKRRTDRVVAALGHLPGIRAEHRFPDHAVGASLRVARSEEHTSELQSRQDLVCRLLRKKKKWPTARQPP